MECTFFPPNKTANVWPLLCSNHAPHQMPMWQDQAHKDPFAQVAHQPVGGAGGRKDWADVGSMAC